MSTHRSVAKPGGRELAHRLMVAAIGLPIVALLLVRGPKASSWLFAAAAAIACFEYCRLTLGRMEPSAWIGVATAALLPLLPAHLDPSRAGASAFALVVAASMSIWTVQLFGAAHSEAPRTVGHVLTGLLFCTGGMVATSALRAGPQGTAWAAVVLVSTWTNDTFAYFGGRAFGRHKLWPAVSPKKTWEGAIAGFCGSIVGLLAIRQWLPGDMDVRFCLGMGAIAGVAAPLGDLCKSMVKRAYQAKDFGALLPGHGGVLDRIDGILFVAPIALLIRIAFFRH